MRATSKIRFAITLLGLGGACFALWARFPGVPTGGEEMMQPISVKNTVSERLNEFGARADARWQPFFERAGVSYPPARLLFLGLKAEKRLEIYADVPGGWRFLRALPILAASGKNGPKLREGDRQVPEGFYAIESFNPNSAYHLSLRVSYPSREDREIAAREGRTQLGGNIMIHGGNASIGCLAMGDEAAEDLFVLAARTGREAIEVWLCPLDFRVSAAPNEADSPPWLKKRYAALHRLVQTLPREPS